MARGRKLIAATCALLAERGFEATSPTMILKLLAAHFADAIDLPTLKRHQDRIRAGLADVERRLAEHDEHHTGGRAFLHDSLRLLTDAHHAYANSDDGNRRLANQAFYTRLEVTEDEQLLPTLAEPFATITEAARGNEAEHEHDTSCDVACSRKELWVDLALHNANRHTAINGPAITVPPLQAKLVDHRPSCRNAILDAIDQLHQHTGATQFARRDIVAEVQAASHSFERQTIYRCIRRMTGHESGSAHHDLEDLGNDQLRLRGD